MPDPFAGRTTRNFRQDHADSTCYPNAAGYCPCPLEQAPEDTAELVCSDIGYGLHKPVIDLDLPARLVSSGTPGHSHLYIDKAVNFDQYMAIPCSTQGIQMTGLDKVEQPDYEIERRTIARFYASRMVCGHASAPGDIIGLTTDGEWVCGRCTR